VPIVHSTILVQMEMWGVGQVCKCNVRLDTKVDIDPTTDRFEFAPERHVLDCAILSFCYAPIPTKNEHVEVPNPFLLFCCFVLFFLFFVALGDV
jgi:hypothetical protein